MIAVRSGETDITSILLEGKHIDLDVQENVSVYYIRVLSYSMRQKNVSKIVPFRSLKRYLPCRLFPVFSSNTVRFSPRYRSVSFRFVSFRFVPFRFVCAPSQWSSNALEI